MPRDDKGDKTSSVGRTFRGETSPPITTPEKVAATWARAAEHAKKPEAITIQVYFIARGHLSPILQASMLAYTDVRTAPPEVFDEIFAEHHEVPSPTKEAKHP